MHFLTVSQGGSKDFHIINPNFSLSLSSSPCLWICCVGFLSTCKQNRGIYSAMHLDKIFNMSSYLNTTVVSTCNHYYMLPSQCPSSLISLFLLGTVPDLNTVTFNKHIFIVLTAKRFYQIVFCLQTTSSKR